MNWFTIVWAGFVAVVLAISTFWLFRSTGLTQFSPTIQVGCLFLRNPLHPWTETAGFTLILLLGSTVVPALYLHLFQWMGGPGALIGLGLGSLHGLLAAAALPLLGTISACVRAGAIPAPGPMGSRWGWLTPVAMVVGHGLYGMVCGAILANV